METLMQFSEKEQNFHQYQARQNFIRQQETMQDELANVLAREKATLVGRFVAHFFHHQLNGLI